MIRNLYNNILLKLTSFTLIISFFFSSAFNLQDKNVQKIIDNNGGKLYGVCHPNENYDMLEDAGIKWVRYDIPCPFDEKGNIRQAYLDFKERCKGYTDRGFKVMATTPYPRDFISDMKYNPIEDIERTKEVAVFLYNDLKDITGGFQITNEMGTGTFMLPLNIEEAALFIGIQLEAISEVKDEGFIIGYNSAGLVEKLHTLMKPYLQYCDYVGIDQYIGAQSNAKPSDYSKEIKKLYRMTQKPIMVMEFGFWSDGGSKTDAEKAEILAYYGYSSEAEAIADSENFLTKLPNAFINSLRTEYPDEENRWSEIIFSEKANHFYGITSDKSLNNIPHTPEGQAEYFTEVMAELQKLNCLAGMFIYCCQDMETCFYCGHLWCPYETRWGLFYLDGTPKPSYYAVKKLIMGK